MTFDLELCKAMGYEYGLLIVQFLHGFLTVTPLNMTRLDVWIYENVVFVVLSLTLSVVLLSSYYTPSFSLKDKHVLITGGSSGIGLATALAYAKQGAKITLVARNLTKLQAAKATIDEQCKSKEHKWGDDPIVHIISCDTSSSQAAVDSALESTKNPFGEVDVLINCAGTSIAGEFETTSTTEFTNMFNTNVMGSVYPTQSLIKSMKKKRRGRIVFVASQVAQVAIHGYTAYAASKWALRGLAEALQMEVKPYGILISIVYPPDTNTPGYEQEMSTKPELTKKLSESGTVFNSDDVAADILKYSCQGYYGISTGFDGWLLKQLHPGFSPLNNLWEFYQGMVFSGLARFIGLFYILAWDRECSITAAYEAGQKKAEESQKSGDKKNQ
jgi:3-dehydrosphinganine reductase